MGKLLALTSAQPTVLLPLWKRHPTVLTTAEGGRILPSIVAFNKNGERMSDNRKRQGVINSDNTVYSIKRVMGRHFEETSANAAWFHIK